MEAIDLSALAYKNKTEIFNTLNQKYKDKRCIDIPETDVQGFFCTRNNIAWVVIRGTEIDSWDDWTTNLSTGFINTQWGEAHEGFVKDAVSAMGMMHTIINLARGAGHKVIFTGHSLGAATAIQMFARATDGLCIPIEAPRSFSKEAAKVFGLKHGNKIYPVVNNNDPVWNMPPKIAGYRHVYHTNVQYIDRKGVVRQGITKWDKFCDSIMGYLYSWFKLKLDSLEDHKIDNIAEIWRRQL